MCPDTCYFDCAFCTTTGLRTFGGSLVRALQGAEVGGADSGRALASLQHRRAVEEKAPAEPRRGAPAPQGRIEQYRCRPPYLLFEGSAPPQLPQPRPQCYSAAERTLLADKDISGGGCGGAGLGVLRDLWRLGGLEHEREAPGVHALRPPGGPGSSSGTST